MELDLVLVATQNISTRILKKSNDSSTSIKFLVHNAEFQELKDLLSRSGMESIRSFPTLTFESYVMLFQAIDSELGIGLAPRILIEKELNSGRFVQVLNVQMQSKNFGYLIVKSNRENYAPLEIFRTWLVELN
jgi:DNA-binding transcriptional LysR family regulator